MNLRKHVSYANVMATMAVFIALGGTSYAAVKINGKSIKNGTVAGKALKKNTLTGTQIREAKLAKVPSAAAADTAALAATASSANLAARATSADSVGGVNVVPIDLLVTPSGSPTENELFKFGSLSINATCSSSDAIPVLARSTADGGIVSGARTALSGGVSFFYDGSLDEGTTSPFGAPFTDFAGKYEVIMRTADGGSATVILNVTKAQFGAPPNKCIYTGVAFIH